MRIIRHRLVAFCVIAYTNVVDKLIFPIGKVISCKVATIFSAQAATVVPFSKVLDETMGIVIPIYHNAPFMPPISSLPPIFTNTSGTGLYTEIIDLLRTQILRDGNYFSPCPKLHLILPDSPTICFVDDKGMVTACFRYSFKTGTSHTTTFHSVSEQTIYSKVELFFKYMLENHPDIMLNNMDSFTALNSFLSHCIIS